MPDTQQRFDFDVDPLEARDAEARRLAIDPRRNVALEASAGTGKTRVLVDRYVGLLAAGVKPRHILAITFTRKAAAEMRHRILQELNARERSKSIPQQLLAEIRENLTDISISTIDAFCLALLREFPLEADVDPAFDLADETETPRLVDDALERTIRIGRGLAAAQAEMALLFGELGEFQLRQGLARLLDRRLVARGALEAFVRGGENATVDAALASLIRRLRDAFASVPGGLDALIATGPVHHEFALFARDVRQLVSDPPPPPAIVQALVERVSEHLLTQSGEPRKRLALYKKSDFRSGREFERHLAMVQALGPYLMQALAEFRHDINIVLARAVRQLFAIALKEYERTLRQHGVLDFSDVLGRTLSLLGQMEEFSRSRFKLEARYHHVLVDEFQDTSRAQWELVELLIRSWAAGVGLAGHEPTIFIVGDRKQSIYGFRDAEVAVLDEAARYIEALRPIGRVRSAITRSFRAVKELLHFVNDVFSAIDKAPDRPDAFRYSEDDAFPLGSVEATENEPLGMVAARSDEDQAEAVADEIAHLLSTQATVRDREAGVRRAVRPGDIAVLFRTRDGHRAFEDALARRNVPYYVYKGLGFFDADEIKDVIAVLSFLAYPESDLHAAAFLRSRFVGLGDEGLKLLAPHLANAIVGPQPPAALPQLRAPDRERLELTRRTVAEWLAAVDRIPPSDIVDRAIAESAYAAEIAGPSYRQARENLKKIRGLVRRIQNRGYVTLGGVVEHLRQLVAGGDESNAMVDALDAVNVMTTHAAKGLEFPIVFVVNLHRGSGGSPDPIRVWSVRDEASGVVHGSVSIGAHVSDGDRDLEARDAEEAKRLLYVAMTRARDRLYLAATVNAEGRLAPGKGGLGRMLPPSLAQLFHISASTVPEVIWQGPTAPHRIRVLQPTRIAQLPGAAASDTEPPDYLSPLIADDPPRRAAGSLLPSAPVGAIPASGAPSSIGVGVLVHRALQAGAHDPEAFLHADERAAIDDVPAIIAAAREALACIRSDPRVAEILRGVDVSWRRHEVPFSCRRRDGVVVRGAIDCLVERTSGAIEVFEFKTGRQHEAHDRQLDIYVDAARQLFAGRLVTGHLVYAGQPVATFPEVGRLTE